jgi:hypothetical protein
VVVEVVVDRVDYIIPIWYLSNNWWALEECPVERKELVMS